MRVITAKDAKTNDVCRSDDRDLWRPTSLVRHRVRRRLAGALRSSETKTQRRRRRIGRNGRRRGGGGWGWGIVAKGSS